MPGAAVTAFFLDNEDWSPIGIPIICVGNVVYRLIEPAGNVVRQVSVAAGNVTRSTTEDAGDTPTGDPC
jgi:hypothetical protein